MIQENTLIADNVSLYDHDHRFLDKKTPIAEQGFCASSIYIGRNCWLATNVVVLKGVNITDHVIVGANAVVTKSLDRAGVYGGIPARFIK